MTDTIFAVTATRDGHSHTAYFASLTDAEEHADCMERHGYELELALLPAGEETLMGRAG